MSCGNKQYIEYTVNMAKTSLRPDLTEYRVYIELLQDELNKESLLKMSMTDVVKILIEQAVSKKYPDIEINRIRKIYQTIDF